MSAPGTLTDRVAIVTGGARGLGAAISQRLAEAGATVVIADIVQRDSRWDRLETAVTRRVHFHETDVTSPESMQAAVVSATDRFGRLDILVNNAALFTTIERCPLESLTAEQWESVLRVNVIGVFNAIAAVTPVMRSAGGGRVINIASNVVFKGISNQLPYVASKGAVVAMTRAAAHELGGAGITVNAVAPGYLKHDDFATWDASRDERIVSLRAISRSETPDDVAGAVLFLASDDSGFITGSTIAVDGGEVYH